MPSQIPSPKAQTEATDALLHEPALPKRQHRKSVSVTSITTIGSTATNATGVSASALYFRITTLTQRLQQQLRFFDQVSCELGAQGRDALLRLLTLSPGVLESGAWLAQLNARLRDHPELAAACRRALVLGDAPDVPADATDDVGDDLGDDTVEPGLAMRIGGLAIDDSVLAALAGNRCDELRQLLERRQTDLLAQLHDALGDDVRVLFADRRALCDREWWQALVARLGGSCPALLSWLREAVGYVGDSDPTNASVPLTVQPLATAPLAAVREEDESAHEPGRRPDGSCAAAAAALRGTTFVPEPVAPQVRVGVRDDPQLLSQLETEQPLFFSLLRAHCGSATAYSRFMALLVAPRAVLADSEWLALVCDRFMGGKSGRRLRQMFREITGAVVEATGDIAQSDDEQFSAQYACAAREPWNSSRPVGAFLQDALRAQCPSFYARLERVLRSAGVWTRFLDVLQAPWAQLDNNAWCSRLERLFERAEGNDAHQPHGLFPVLCSVLGIYVLPKASVAAYADHCSAQLRSLGVAPAAGSATNRSAGKMANVPARHRRHASSPGIPLVALPVLTGESSADALYPAEAPIAGMPVTGGRSGPKRSRTVSAPFHRRLGDPTGRCAIPAPDAPAGGQLSAVEAARGRIPLVIKSVAMLAYLRKILGNEARHLGQITHGLVDWRERRRYAAASLSFDAMSSRSLDDDRASVISATSAPTIESAEAFDIVAAIVAETVGSTHPALNQLFCDWQQVGVDDMVSAFLSLYAR